MPKKRKPIRRHSTSDPRKLSGDIVGPGGPHDVGAVLVDTRNGILLDSTTVSTIDDEESGQSAIALLLGGRINRSTDRAQVLFMFGTDGLAGIVTELMALLARANGTDATAIMEDILERMKKLREEGNLD